ncbi:MAG: ATP phosphoribosyltransferase [Chloroflexi bacterium]|nr:ATP phosphoribosyltransferase [Chloroflexota bacterium]
MIEPNFAQMNNLIPAVIQDYENNQVLMVGYMNEDAFRKTLSTGKVHYFSRKKKRIWQKGEQSGNYQLVKKIFMNCDNTSLLILVDQVGGACDLGFRSCFEKVMENGEFSEIGVKVFDPKEAYGDNYTEKISLGIPSGSLEGMTFQLIQLAGYEIERKTNRSYHPKILSEPNINLVMARAQELPHLVSEGVIDAAITGIDLVVDSGVSIRDVCDLGYNKLGAGPVMLMLAVPETKNVATTNDLNGLRIASMYQNLVSSFFEARGIKVEVLPSIGATEGKVPLISDAVVDLVETGETLRANGLKPIMKLFETTVHLVASNKSWGYTWKRRKLEEIASRLMAACNQLPKSTKKNISIDDVSLLTDLL